MAEDARPHLSIVIPCFNEERRLPATLTRVLAFLDTRPYSAEVLVVDDGSVDRTRDVASASGDPRVRLLQYGRNEGKGFAVAYGSLRARGEWVLFSDADLSTPIEELDLFLRTAEAGADVVMGSRAIAGARLEVRQPWWRERAGRAMNRLIRWTSALPYADTQCGFKLFSRVAVRDIFSNLTVRGWMFDVEALVIAAKFGYRVAEIPVRWVNSGDSRVRLSHSPGILVELLRIRSYWLVRQPTRGSDDSGLAVDLSR